MSGNQNGGSWAFDTERTSGYTYPADAHLAVPNTIPIKLHDSRIANIHRIPRRRRPRWPAHARPTRLNGFKIGVALALTAIAGSMAMAVLTAGPVDPDRTLQPLSVTGTAISSDAMGAWPGMFTAPTRTLSNPYADSGTWSVGTDLPAGRYRVTVTGELGGYWARCSAEPCEPGAGLLANAALPRGAAETILLILPTDQLVKTAGVRLIPS